MAALGSASAANVSTQWVEIANNYPSDAVPNYSAAVTANDPILASTPARTFDLVVTIGGGAYWASCDLQINASPQTIYYKSGSSPYNPASSTWPSQPSAQFSSFICTPGFMRLGAPLNDPEYGGSALGMAQYPVESGVGPPILNNSKIDVAWGDVTWSANTGSFTTARVTMLNSFGGGITFAGRVGTVNNLLPPSNFSFTAQEIPEPMTAGLLALPLLLARRRSHSR
jgi:hypothetical protein